MRHREYLPVAEVGGQHERTTVTGHDSVEVLETVQADACQRGVHVAQEPGQLCERHAEMLRGATRQAQAFTRRQLGIGARQIAERDPPAAPEESEAGIAQAAADPEGGRQGQTTQRARGDGGR
jgi:hypothetical protein